MASETAYFCYQLKSHAKLNAKTSRQSFDGLLVKAGSGHGCIHPWPELGDLPIEKQLSALKNGTSTPLIDQALSCAKLDGDAREKGISLFTDQPLPPNHWLQLSGIDRDPLFTTVKWKVSPETLPCLTEEALNTPNIKIRLDANETLDYDTVVHWWKHLPTETQQAIEFFEDPIPWNQPNWQNLHQLGIPIAADRELNERYSTCDWHIIKPATDSHIPTKPGSRKVFTSYMDHPIGQLWAAYQAQNYYTNKEPEICGLLTHLCFETNEFSERLRIKPDTSLEPPTGTGLGFDDLLEKLPWKKF